MKNKIEFIAFDADDTLWENELYFQELEHKFCHLLRKYSPAPSVSEELFKTEIKNLHIYGYGLKGMLLCMIETICKVTNGEGDLNLVKEILRSGQELLQRPITLLDGVQEVISALHENYKLVLATKGDLFDQKRKISASGLQEYRTFFFQGHSKSGCHPLFGSALVCLFRDETCRFNSNRRFYTQNFHR